MQPVTIKPEQIKGVYRSPGELVEAVFALQIRDVMWVSEKIKPEELSDRARIARFIRNTYGIDRRTKRELLRECDRLFSMKEMART